MSKEIFSRNVMFGMYERLKAIDQDNFQEYLSYDENFALIIALAYMTLSKEKIIKKDMNNPHRLERITNKVPQEYIDSLFEGEVVPKIITTEEEDYTWILDNIRDSIMHEKFDIDEKRRLVLINNDYYDRNLKAEVPFEWFIKYMEKDILSKRFTDKCTIQRFFYNNYHEPEDYLNTRNITNNSILYRLDIEGDNLPIEEIEDKVSNWMYEYSSEPLDEKDLYKYEVERSMEPYYYNREYFSSFMKARIKVKEKLQEEYPDSNIRIFIDNRRNKINKKAKRKLLNTYKCYDDLYQDLNSILERKGLSLLNTIDSLYSFIKDNKNNNELNNYLNLIDLMKIVNGKQTSISNDYDTNYNNYIEAKQKLFTVYLHIYGLTAIVLNKEKLEHPAYLHLLDKSILSYSKKSFDEYTTERLKVIKKVLGLNIKKQESQNNYDRCPEEAKERLKKFLDISTNNYNDAVEEYNRLKDEFRPVVINYKAKEKYAKKRDMLLKRIESCENLFISTEDIDTKKTLKATIIDLYNKLTEVESKYLYRKTSPKETLEIMRNCFSHIGRINISNYMPITENRIIFLDYDKNNELSGKIECNFMKLVRALDDTIDFTTNEDKTISIRLTK